MSTKKKATPLGAKFKDAVRKQVVSIKRNPQMFPLIMLLIAFLYYSLNLTNMSNTTALVQGKGMGLCQFCIMLFSILSMVCMLNAFPRRQKPNYAMILIMFVMFGIMLYADVHYCNGIAAAVNRADSPIKLGASTMFVVNAYNMLNTFAILIGITAVLVVTLPVYSKLLKKINTSIEVEDNGEMGEIEIED